MAAVSTTVTCGQGSERHNHDWDYRKTLEHVHGSPDDVVELVPYEKSYKEQINDLLKPYIDDYNRHQDEKYDAAWEKYRAGERKSKPKRRDYPHMDYDYYEAHKDDEVMNPHTNKKEHVPIFRSMIIGLGDQSDRHAGVITKDQAEAVFRQLVELFQEKFPYLKILGATMHLDEDGFYHMHLDYKPVMATTFAKGLQVTVSQDAVLEGMGLKPEQSIINGKDKAPIRFNALRNQVYYMVEKGLNAQGLRLQYGVTAIKQPGKDSSKNQSLGDWQTQQDAALEMQDLKNKMLDIIEDDDVSPEGYKQLVDVVEKIKKWWHGITHQPFWRRSKDGVVVEFHAFDQLTSLVNQFFDMVGHAFQQIRHWQDRAERAEKQAAELSRENAGLKREVAQLRPLADAVTPELIEQAQFFEYAKAVGSDVRNEMLWAEFQQERDFLAEYLPSDRPSEQLQAAVQRSQELSAEQTGAQKDLNPNDHKTM